MERSSRGVILKTNCFPANSELQKHKSRKLYLHVPNRPPFALALKKIAFHWNIVIDFKIGIFYALLACEKSHLIQQLKE